MHRMWVAGAAIVMCLALGGLSVAGQEEAEQPTAAADGTASDAMATGPVVFAGTATCGVTDTEEWAASDPRVTGPCSIAPAHFGGWLEEGQQISIPGAVGDYAVNGPEGDWTGTWLLIHEYPIVARNFMALDGTGTYEGSAVLAWAGTPDGWQEGDPFDLEGIIYEGSTPSLHWPEE